MMGGYDAVKQEEHEQVQDHGCDDEDEPTGSAGPPQPAPHSNTGYTKLGPRPSNGHRIKNLVCGNPRTAGYEMVEEDEDEEFDAAVASSTPQNNTSPAAETHPVIPLELQIRWPRARRPGSPTKSATAESTFSSRSIASKPVLRTASGRSIALRHPTPDLQTLQGAYTSNIEHLEKTAERLSMTSSIEDAIKELHDEQKRSDSRRSSLLSSQSLPQVSRQVSNASSIVEVNSAARSGGFSPAGYIMSPGGSFTTGSGRGRSLSKSSRFRPEPELEGRPLDSFVNMHSSISPPPPTFSPSASIAEMHEEFSILTKPIAELELLASPEVEESPAMANEEQDRPTTSASINTVEQEKMFADFDGIHSAPPQQRTVSRNGSNNSNETQRRASSGNRLSMARPQSYADPSTGQQMVYYPAPVPMMLNLPQKLSKNPSSQARNKRRSQVLSSIPPAARQSAIWLPDVLEDEDAQEMAADDPIEQQEYIPQHQRASMGGRRLTQDLSHMPAQLRANTYFELPASNQTIELKEQSAVATLDSILDASAYAPVTAFTDHAFAGHLGAEVYGREPMKHNRTSTTLAEPQSKKRTNTFNILLRGRRGSSTDLLDSDTEKRRATMSGVVESRVRLPIEDEDEDEQTAGPLHSGKGKGEDDEESDEGQRDDEIYHGAPTTLLAELQLRKQQQKQRTRPLLQAFPNGMHSTLLEMDAVAQVEQKSRKQKRVNLAWEDPSVQQPGDDLEDDEDVPLAMLYAKKEARDPNRPMGLMERRDMEDNEPLSRRRDRLQGRQPIPRASTMMHIASPIAPEEEDETLAERVRRLKEQATTDNGLPSARPVSGDFTLELMNQFGGDLLDVKDPKGKAKEISTSPGPEEEETLGQRRKRLQAERAAREKEVAAGAAAGSPPQRPEINKRRSMADILQAHPAAGASRNISYEKPVVGLLGLHEKTSAQRSSTMLDFNTAGPGLGNPLKTREVSGGFRNGVYNDGQGGIIPPQQQQQQAAFNVNGYGNQPMFPQPSLGMRNPATWGSQMFANPYAVAYPGMQIPMPMGYMPAMNGMNMNMGMGMGMQPLNQGQIDMVERWRQSVMQ